jgi:hypothetical protein
MKSSKSRKRRSMVEARRGTSSKLKPLVAKTSSKNNLVEEGTIYKDLMTIPHLRTRKDLSSKKVSTKSQGQYFRDLSFLSS